MRKRVLGSLTLCLTTAGAAMADGIPPGTLPLSPPPAATAPQTGQNFLPQATTRSQEDKGTPRSPKLEPITPAPPTAPAGSSMAPGGPANGSCDATVPKPNPLRDDHWGPGNTFWVHGDYLLWWIKRGPLPVPIVSSANGVLLGNSHLDYGSESGGRLSAGCWLEDSHVFGIELGGFLLQKPSVSSAVQSDVAGNPSLVRPFFNPTTLAPDQFLVAVPNVYAGGLAISSTSRFWGSEANLIRNLAFCPEITADLQFGFRYLDLTESLNIDENMRVLADTVHEVVAGIGFDVPASVPFPGRPGGAGRGSVLAISDSFNTRNRFYGGQIGAHTALKFDRIHVDLTTKVALGPNYEAVTVNGLSKGVFPDGTTGSVPGGVLALSGANMGRSTTHWFTVVPEVGIQVGFLLTDNLRLQVGYSFLYINNAVRPGDQINTTINPQFVPTSPAFGSASLPNEPHPFFRQGDFWVHGITAGISFHF
jgi:hypothetical protein